MVATPPWIRFPGHSRSPNKRVEQTRYRVRVQWQGSGAQLTRQAFDKTGGTVKANGKRRMQREVSVAGHCMHAGAEALEQAEQHGPGYEGWRTASAMCAVSMWAFALEADVNYLLDRVLQVMGDVSDSDDPSLDEAYWFGLRERIELFYKWVGGNPPNFGCRPFQVVTTLKFVRDSIVHGKPHYAIGMVQVDDGEVRRLPHSLKAPWEPECTIEQAKRHRDDVLTVHCLMLEAAGGRLGRPIGMLSVESVDLAGTAAPFVEPARQHRQGARKVDSGKDRA